MNHDHTDPIARGVAVFGEMHPPARTAAFAAATDPAMPGGRMQRIAAEFVFARSGATPNDWIAGRVAL